MVSESASSILSNSPGNRRLQVPTTPGTSPTGRSADRNEPEVAQLKKARLQDKIEALKQQMQQLKEFEAQMLASPDQQLSLTDPDARSMKCRDGGIVGYNVQTAVDAQHHLIVAHDVVTEGVDRDLLSTMAEQARTAMGLDGQRLVKHYTNVERGLTLHTYWCSVCPSCPMKAQCTTGQERRLRRWEHKTVLEAMR